MTDYKAARMRDGTLYTGSAFCLGRVQAGAAVGDVGQVLPEESYRLSRIDRHTLFTIDYQGFDANNQSTSSELS